MGMTDVKCTYSWRYNTKPLQVSVQIIVSICESLSEIPLEIQKAISNLPVPEIISSLGPVKLLRLMPLEEFISILFFIFNPRSQLKILISVLGLIMHFTVASLYYTVVSDLSAFYLSTSQFLS